MVKRRHVTLLISLVLFNNALIAASPLPNLIDSIVSQPDEWPDIMHSLSTMTTLAALASSATAAWWQPTAGETWNIQLISVPSVSQADDTSYKAWDYDLYDAPASTISAFKNKGHPVICYFSAGSWEKWRPDADDFPKAALGKALDGWPGEKWLDVRNTAVRNIMKKRIALAKQKGCDAVDPDNMDGYGNDTGFDLTEADAVDYLKFLAQTAHDEGLACSLKNAGDIIPRVVDVADFSVNEQCVKYSECDLYQPFIEANKPVFHIEYTAKDPAPSNFVKKSCENNNAKGFSTVIKHLNLNAWTTNCP